jgi:putative ABC transport system substrate-binding protein
MILKSTSIKFATVLAILLLVAPFATEAQPTEKISRIGFLRRTSPQPSDFEAFRQGLRELGHIEGQNIAIAQRYANEVADRLPDLAAELVRLKVDLIVVDGTATARAAKAATQTIPIVFTLAVDPVGTGLVANFARPGGNVTGLTQMAPELNGKRLELLKDLVPGLSRVAVLLNPANPSVPLQLREIEAAAQALGVQLQVFEVRDPKEFDRAFSAMAEGRARALTPLTDAMFFSRRGRIVQLASKNRLPAIYEERRFVEAGGLMSYATSIPDLWRRAAAYADKILKGAKPGDLPVEQPTKFELIINLRTAKALGLTIPPSLLLQAHQIIE